MAQLRDPEHGCPWDKTQSFSSLIPYIIEEAYEVVDAIHDGDEEALRNELGDLLLQVVFQSQLGKEKGIFDFESVARSVSDKLVRRHPHVFADVQYKDDEERKNAWNMIKAAEKKERGIKPIPDSVLDNVLASFPALMQAQRTQDLAADHGFDWPQIAPVFEKVLEELGEVKEAVQHNDQNKIIEEIGDLLFVVVNLARHLKVDSEIALKQSNRKFKTRFRYIENQVKSGNCTLKECELAELDALWDEAKKEL